MLPPYICENMVAIEELIENSFENLSSSLLFLRNSTENNAVK